MPDLSLTASHQFWHQYEDPIIYRVLTFMEGVEYWTLDENPNAEFENHMRQLGEELDDISNVNLTNLGHEAAFIKIACNVKMSRTLRMLQSIDTAHPGSASKLLVHAEENSQSPTDTAGVFLRRNIVFERLRLLSRVFSPQRFSLVLRALEGEDHD